MDRQEFDENVVDFLYDELDPSERAAFHSQVQSDPEFASEAHEFQRVSQLFRSQLPDLSVPPALTRRVLDQVQAPKRRVSWFRIEWGTFWRPALTGAFALALTLGILYQYKQHRHESFPVAKNTPVEKAAPEPLADRGGELRLQDVMAAASQPRAFPAPAWRQPRFGNGLISFASYGNTSPMDEAANSDEIYGLDQQAQNSVASFAHQQAMRMHAMGDHKGAAEALAKLIQQYPNYPRLFEALALRIGCLFQIGEVQKARQELGWLRQNSPELAQLVEQRWFR
ncbi:MAG: tetratricopeptide repeat protein [bacterium]